MIHAKKIMSTTGLLLISSMILISSVAADDTTMSTTSVDGGTAAVTTNGGDMSVTTTSSDNSTSSSDTFTTTAEPVTTSTTPVNATADRNNDGIVDAFEKCAFVEKKIEAQCNPLKEAIKKKMWEMYGSGAYNPNAFERNEKGGVIIKEMYQEKKKMKQEIKDMREDGKEQVKEMRQEVKTVRRALSEKLHNQLMKALDKIAAEKKEAMFKKVIANVDRAVEKVTASSMTEEKKARMLAQLAEIKAIVQEKLDALSGNTTESNILQDVLSGTEE